MVIKLISKKEIGKNIKEARKIKSKSIGKRYTQKMLQQDTGLSQGYISDIEVGRSFPSLSAAENIAKACGVTINFIVENRRCNNG